MPTIVDTNLGTVQIEPVALTQIVGVSAMESYGIVGMASKNAADGIFQLLRFENLSKGIEVDIDEASTNIELHVILEYGVRTSAVGEDIINRVRFNMEQMTGLTVDNVKTLVEGIRMD